MGWDVMGTKTLAPAREQNRGEGIQYKLLRPTTWNQHSKQHPANIWTMFAPQGVT